MNILLKMIQLCAPPSRRRFRPSPSVLLAAALASAAFTSAQPPPLVYEVENTGAHFPKPNFPAYDQLPIVSHLPDPFSSFDGSGRDLSFTSWERRRNEIKASIERYEIGPKPDTSDLSISAVYTPGSPGVLTVTILRLTNGRTLRLTSPINLPQGTPPPEGWPAIIRMALAPGFGANSLGIATIDYMHNDVTEYAAGQQISHAADPYFLMYPEYNAGPCPPAPAPCGEQVGQYSAWAWGVSRLIDGMEIASKQAVNPLPINLRRLGVVGCSYAGKMALFAGAFDERIAATFAQESGGGGAPAWRVSHGIEPDGTVEKSNNTDGSWFRTPFKTEFGSDRVYKLPHDHHELMAMVAPRALLVSGNTDFTWLSNRSAYVSALAVQKVYEAFGIGDRFGYYIDGGHGHCAIPAAQQVAVNGFWRKFLLGEEIDWDVRVFPQTPAFTEIDTDVWMPWADESSGNAAPVVDQPVVSPEPSFKGQSATAGAGFRDADENDGPFVWTVDYGDGSGEQLGEVDGDIGVGPDHVYEHVGTYTVTVTVTDKNGHSGVNSVEHDVIYDFDGFYDPVQNPPVVNVMAAGRAIAVKFSLAGDQGTDIFAAGYPQSQQVSCDLGLPMFEIEQTVSASSSSLSYDATTDQYTYVWKTDKAWSGTCRIFTIKLSDGQEARANFRFK